MDDKPKKSSEPKSKPAAEGASEKDATNVKKVRAYPIAATVEYKSIKKPVQVMKLATVGFWASLGTTLVQVGVTYNIEFELPVLHSHILCPAKALRTMDRVHENQGKRSVERLAEFQFVKPSAENLEQIRKFLAAINQPNN